MVNEFYFKHKISKTKIAIEMKVSRNFVTRWTQSEDQDFTIDNRGWEKGKARKWEKEIKERIKDIRLYLENDSFEFYYGATAIQQEWRRRYPKEVSPPLRTIGKYLSDLGLAQKRKIKHKGAARYLCYPEHTIYNQLGNRVAEIDFIGKKYIHGSSEPLNFIGFSFKKEPRLRYYKRIEGQTTDSFITETDKFFGLFEKPDVIKLDNGLAFIGSASGKRNISRSMNFLLENNVIPVFAVPRKPFTQASIEGNNSVFSKKFWNRFDFKSLKEIDDKLELFNRSSRRYTEYKRPEKNHQKRNFTPKIYFIRQVKEVSENKKIGAYVNILNVKIPMPKSLVNYYVLSEWNLNKETLNIYFEKDKMQNLIKKIDFKINKKSKDKFDVF